MKQIQVGLGERVYPIIIQEGLLENIAEDLRDRNFGKRYIVIADQYVAELYADKLLGSLRDNGLPVDLVTFPRGEGSKNLQTIAALSSRLAQLGVDRKDALIALGGGVTGDITGFLAAIYMRGIPFVQVPTTLLAQVDSSVGGKTGVDIPEGKNLVGCFYQPRAVYIDSSVLKTLPRSELLNGLAEVIKYSVIRDKEFFEFLAVNREGILRLDLQILEEVILKCCTIKAQVVEADERESDLRRILNFGHTLGHAVEGASDYSIDHGLGVAIGMVAVCEIAVEKGLLSKDDAGQVRKLIADFGLAVTIPALLDRKRIKGYLKTDKKAVSGRPFFVLPTEIGKVIISDDVSEDQIDAVL
ncbi:MAG: 3-dehydroquinate synthase [Proteobacteria bacterium]|nr:3-dehydroquinate synthase [Pseudomonadota bacterium]MBU1710250.1 3-dehydroquinate synthase [Pseudomonadota bacterium]